ncbi:MAG: Hint domain-containing protein [Nanoarchaeota archaeon]
MKKIMIVLMLVIFLAANTNAWEWVQIGELKPGDSLMDKDGNEIIINSIEEVRDANGVMVYDLEIKDYHYYFAEDVLVHNSQIESPVDKWKRLIREYNAMPIGYPSDAKLNEIKEYEKNTAEIQAILKQWSDSVKAEVNTLLTSSGIHPGGMIAVKKEVYMEDGKYIPPYVLIEIQDGEYEVAGILFEYKRDIQQRQIYLSIPKQWNELKRIAESATYSYTSTTDLINSHKLMGLKKMTELKTEVTKSGYCYLKIVDSYREPNLRPDGLHYADEDAYNNCKGKFTPIPQPSPPRFSLINWLKDIFSGEA